MSASPPVLTGTAVTDPAKLNFVTAGNTAARVASREHAHCYTLFDRQMQTRLVKTSQLKLAATCIGQASAMFGHFDSPPSLRILQMPITGLPTPQITATPSSVSHYTRTWPVDARALGFGICVVDGPLMSTPFSLAYQVKGQCGFLQLHQGLARGCLTASAAGRPLAPFEPLPLRVDSLLLLSDSISAAPCGSDAQLVSPLVASVVQDLRDLEVATFEHGPDYLLMLHVPGQPPYCLDANRLQTLDALTSAASELLRPELPHANIQLHWPGQVPAGTDCFLHALVEVDNSFRGDHTLALFDGRTLDPCGPGFRTLLIPAVVTLGELFGIARDLFPESWYPSQIRLNGRVLQNQALMRLYCPLIRVVTIAGAYQLVHDRFASALPTQELLDVIPGLAIAVQSMQDAHGTAEVLEWQDWQDDDYDTAHVSLLQSSPPRPVRCPSCFVGQCLPAAASGDLSMQSTTARVALDFWPCDFEAWTRGFLLLQLCAFFRLWLFALPKRPHTRRRNSVLQSSRLVVRGAPLCLCLALCFTVASGAPPPEFSGSGIASLADNPANVACHSVELRPQHDLLDPVPHQCPNRELDLLRAHCFAAPSSATFHPPLLPEDSCFVPVRVLRYQSEALQMSVDVGVYKSPANFSAHVETELRASKRHCRFLVVDPQPSADYVALLAAPKSAERMFLVPVCIQLQAGADMLRIWADLLDPDITYDGFRMSLGQDWPAGARIFVGGSSCQLGEYTSARLTPGTLVRILAPGRPIRALATLETKLRYHDQHLRDVIAEGYPADDYRPHRYGLLQPLSEARSVDFSPISGMQALDSVLNSHSDLDFGPTAVFWPAAQPDRHFVRGRPVDKTAAAFPVSCTTRCPLFIDGRAVGTPFQVYAAPSGWMLVRDLFNSIGLTVPWSESLQLSGTVQSSVDRRAVQVESAALLVLRYSHPEDGRSGVVHLDDSDSQDGSDDGPSRSAPDGHGTQPAIASGSSCPEAKRFRSSTIPPASDSATRLVALRVDSGEKHISSHTQPGLAHDTRNRCIDDHAHALRHTEDASVTQTNVPRAPGSAYHSPFFSTEMGLAMLNAAPLVYQEGDFPPDPLVVSATGAPGQNGGDQAPAEGAADDDLKRVPVAVLTFQSPSRQHTLWVSGQEPLASVLVRANILLNPDPAVMDLVPADPQPPVEHFVLVLVPKWWPQAGVRPFVCMLNLPGRQPFAHAVFHSEDLDASLPQAVFEDGAQLDLYLPPSDAGDPDPHVNTIWPAQTLQPGSLLMFQPQGLLPPLLSSPTDRLSAMEHVDAHAFPDTVLYRPHPCDVVLLGVGYEQFVLRLGSMPIRLLVARHLDMAATDVFLHHQAAAFTELTVAGRPISVCFGFRSKAIFGEEPAGRGVFIDSRAVGRPVVYRSVQAHRLHPTDVCSMLDVQVPAGYQVCLAGAARCCQWHGYFLVEHGMSLVVWLEPLLPVNLTDSGSATASDHSDDAGSDGDAATEASPRSRSPRRQLSTSPAQVAGSRTGGPQDAVAVMADDTACCPGQMASVAHAATQHDATTAPEVAPLHAARQQECLRSMHSAHVALVATPCRSRWPVPHLAPASGPTISAGLPSLNASVPAASCEDCRQDVCAILPSLDAPLTALEYGRWHWPAHVCATSSPHTHSPVQPSASEALTCRGHPLCLEDLCPTTEFQRLVLDLQSLLPAKPTKVEFGDDWLDADMTAVLRSPYLTRDLAFRFAQVRTVWQARPVASPVALHIYTDGSSGGDVEDGYVADCALAFSVWAVYPDHELLVGHAAHSSVPPGTRYHLGEVDSTPLTAEQLALLWAFCWVIEVGSGTDLPIVVCYDCTTAGDVAFASARSYSTTSAKGCGSLREALCILRQCACVRTTLIPRHVRSHVGVLQNEFSDQLAKHARRSLEHVENRTLPTWPARLVQYPLFRWSWMADRQFADLPTLFAMESEAGRLQVDRSVALPPQPLSGAPKFREDAKALLHLKFVSYNALTLRDPRPSGAPVEASAVGVGVRISGRRELLKTQFDCLGVQFIGLQETRTPETALLPDAHYWMLHSACDQHGSFGTAPWISKSAPYGCHGSARLRVELHHIAACWRK